MKQYEAPEVEKIQFTLIEPITDQGAVGGGGITSDNPWRTVDDDDRNR